MSKWKGLVLAGGTGSRLHPLTRGVNKHLLPVYDKPMIYYPISTLMMGGIREFVIVSMPEALPQFKTLLGSGEKWGVEFTYVAQSKAKGIADGLVVAADELAHSNVALILGDNIFYGTGLPDQISQAMNFTTGATIFGYQVNNPSQFGVVELDGHGKPVSLIEKPKNSNSKLAVPGLYFYDTKVLDIAKSIKPSHRGEVEITDINKVYMEQSALRVSPLGRGTAWLDGGTHQDLFEASQFVKVMEERTGLKIACPEEVAFHMKYIDAPQLDRLVPKPPKTHYDRYLQALVDEIM